MGPPPPPPPPLRSACREDLSHGLQLGVVLDGLLAEVARQLLAVVRDHLLQAGHLVRLQLLALRELVRELRAVHGVRRHPARPVLHDRLLRLVLEGRLPRRHDLRALHREAHVFEDEGLDGGLGLKGIENAHLSNSCVNGLGGRGVGERAAPGTTPVASPPAAPITRYAPRGPISGGSSRPVSFEAWFP